MGGAVLKQPSAKLDREIFEGCPSTKIGPLENFPLYKNVVGSELAVYVMWN